MRFSFTTFIPLIALLLTATGNNAFCADAWPTRSLRFIVCGVPALLVGIQLLRQSAAAKS